MRKKKVSVLLDAPEYEKFKDFCRDRGHKKSTLISKLIRDFLASEDRKSEGIRSKAEVKKSSSNQRS